MQQVYLRAQLFVLFCFLFAVPQTLAGVDDDSYPHIIDTSSGDNVVEVHDINFSADDHEALIAQQPITPPSLSSNKSEKRALKLKHKAEIRALNRRFQDDLHRLELRQEAAIKALEAGH
ncbi:MAG: hypothetical protein K2Y18_06420 [Alphaproteobacteria bacterium]|jgi:hypothetical protein|nr:hypothetical protein [Alphaproteobacteria bacterium]